MATDIKVWRVSETDHLEPVEDGEINLEKHLETWVKNSPTVLGEDLLVIARQLIVGGVGILDLLCLDSAGLPVIVEFKRDSTAREAIAQSLDYASWLDSLTTQDLEQIAVNNVNKSLADAFADHFGSDPPVIDCTKHRILLVAPRLDAAAERIISYLRARYGIAINAVFFKYVEVGDERILARSVLVRDEARPKGEVKHISESQLIQIAEDRRITPLVEICRRIKTESRWDGGPARVWGGSWVYSLMTENGFRVLLGINVAGNMLNTPSGELDVWIRLKNLAEVTGNEENFIRGAIAAAYPPFTERFGNYIIRLKNKDEAEGLVKHLIQLTSGPKLKTAAA